MRLNVDYKDLDNLFVQLQETLPDGEKLTRIEVKRFEAIFCMLAEISNGGWISVKDRLPEKYERVLTYDNRCGVKENWAIRLRPYVEWS